MNMKSVIPALLVVLPSASTEVGRAAWLHAGQHHERGVIRTVHDRLSTFSRPLYDHLWQRIAGLAESSRQS